MIRVTLAVESGVDTFGSPVATLNFALKFIVLRAVSLAHALLLWGAKATGTDLQCPEFAGPDLGLSPRAEVTRCERT